MTVTVTRLLTLVASGGFFHCALHTDPDSEPPNRSNGADGLLENNPSSSNLTGSNVDIMATPFLCALIARINSSSNANDMIRQQGSRSSSCPVYCDLVGGVAQLLWNQLQKWMPPKLFHSRCSEHGSENKNPDCNNKDRRGLEILFVPMVVVAMLFVGSCGRQVSDSYSHETFSARGQWWLLSLRSAWHICTQKAPTDAYATWLEKSARLGHVHVDEHGFMAWDKPWPAHLTENQKRRKKEYR